MTTDHQRKRELLEAAQAAVSTPVEPAAGSRDTTRPTNWRLVWTCLGLFVAIGGGVLIFRPDWIYPAPPPEEAPGLTDASIRLAMVRERQRVQAFVQANGVLPSSMAEAGGTLAGLALIPDDGSGYTLRYSGVGQVVELRSTDSLEGFLGNSLQVILTRGAP
jgi:hypothetical protein